jgi:hypothetical protein
MINKLIDILTKTNRKLDIDCGTVLWWSDIAGNSLEDLVKRQHHALTELLRHFWMCFPTTTKFLEEKARQ